MKYSDIRARMEHSRVLYSCIKILRKLGFVHILHIVQSNEMKKRLEGESEFTAFYKEHESEFQQVYNLLEDKFSKKTYEAIIEYRKFYDIRYLKGVVVYPQYFLKDILPPLAREVFVDGGAYIGDSSREFIKHYQETNDYKIFCWEPDAENAIKIHKTLKGNTKYEILPYIMWSKPTQLYFSNQGTGTSEISKEGIEIDADSIDSRLKGEKITFIKMDIEGAEIEALKGAEKIIKTQKPKLAICIYHRYDHLYRIPLMIKEMVPEYKIFIRHHSDTASETVLYAMVYD